MYKLLQIWGKALLRKINAAKLCHFASPGHHEQLVSLASSWDARTCGTVALLCVFFPQVNTYISGPDLRNGALYWLLHSKVVNSSALQFFAAYI